jgi:hypothetical protein
MSKIDLKALREERKRRIEEVAREVAKEVAKSLDEVET